MLTIKVEPDYKDALAQFGLEPYTGITVMTVRSSGELLGLGTMRVFGKYASIDGFYFKLESDAADLTYGLGKSMLNMLDLHGVRYVVSNGVGMEKHLSELGFVPIEECPHDIDIPDDWRLCLNLDGYFTSNC